MSTCAIYHKWTKWSEPEERDVEIYRLSTHLGAGKASFQKRKCIRCNKAQERKVRGATTDEA